MPATPLVRIFYAEDDEDIQRIVRMSLERIGKMEVRIVSDPLQAVDAIAQYKPQLVMLDWMMPGMDGPTLLKTMREQPETASYPVVFITAKATQKDHAELLELGAAGIVSKPFSPKDLPEQLRTIWAGLP